jgi:hypothetical protein
VFRAGSPPPIGARSSGLGEHFKAPPEATIALSVFKAIERPSRELDAAIGKKYAANTGLMRERFTLRVGKLGGLPVTFLYR